MNRPTHYYATAYINDWFVYTKKQKKKNQEKYTYINCSENGMGTETTSMDNKV